MWVKFVAREKIEADIRVVFCLAAAGGRVFCFFFAPRLFFRSFFFFGLFFASVCLPLQASDLSLRKMSRLRQFESDAYGMVKQNDSKPDSGYDTDTDDDDDDDDDDDIEKAHRIARSDPNEAKDADSLPLLGHHTKSKSSHFYKQNSVPLVNGKIPGYEAQPKVAQALYQPQNQAHLLRSTPVTTADVRCCVRGMIV